MGFTNNRLELINLKSYDEITHARAFALGLVSFVTSGLELTGITLTNGTFVNSGAFGQLGNVGESQDITNDFTGFLIIKSTFDGNASSSEIIESATAINSDLRDTSNIKYFTIYELENGLIKNDFRHINYVKSLYFEAVSANTFVMVLNGFRSQEFSGSALTGFVDLFTDQSIDGIKTFNACPKSLVLASENDDIINKSFFDTYGETLIPFNNLTEILFDPLTPLDENAIIMYDFQVQGYTGDVDFRVEATFNDETASNDYSNAFCNTQFNGSLGIKKGSVLESTMVLGWSQNTTAGLQFRAYGKFDCFNRHNAGRIECNSYYQDGDDVSGTFSSIRNKTTAITSMQFFKTNCTIKNGFIRIINPTSNTKVKYTKTEAALLDEITLQPANKKGINEEK